MAIHLNLLTFVRSSELRFARWSEIDFKSALWVIPERREAIDGIKPQRVVPKCAESIMFLCAVRLSLF